MRRGNRPAILAVVILTVAAAAGGWAQAQTPAAMIDGNVVSVSGNDVVLTAADGTTKTVTIGDGTLILARQTTTLDSIKAGDALAVTSHRSNGVMVASNVNILSPELWSRITRKGQFPMQSGDTMTNAVVTQTDTSVNGSVLTMQVEDRTEQITVPQDAQVHRLITERAGDLRPGMHVVVRGTAGQDGAVAASTINFELPAAM